MSLHIPNTSYQKERLTTSKIIDSFCISSNNEYTPEEVAAQLLAMKRQAESKGWTDIKVVETTRENEYGTTESVSLGIRGKIRESDEDYKRRQGWIYDRFKNEYDEFLQLKRIYESDIGKARLEILQQPRDEFVRKCLNDTTEGNFVI